ncbi:NUDIX hydrolase [Bacillus carboniphilus]|uniref:NUDIX hydrolase n=1 Tax=Bacillus carboniphilus TaxID=86663 RepID=A0ABN0WQK4_9BACI
MGPRANALGLIVNGDYILLEEQAGKHSRGTGAFYRPIGGTIEFGERSVETLKREFKEELDVEVFISRYITCLENIYTIEEDMAHEITQIYVVEFKDPSLYKRDVFTVTEGNIVTQARWISLKELEHKVLFPNGLMELLKREFMGGEE